MFIYDDLDKIEDNNTEIGVSPLSFEVLDCNK